MRSKKSETQWTLLFCRFVKTSGLDSWTLIFGRFVKTSGLDSWTLVFGSFVKTSGLDSVLLWVKTRLEVPNSSFCSIAEKSNKCLPKLFASHNLVKVAHKKWVRHVENTSIFLIKSQKQSYNNYVQRFLLKSKMHTCYNAVIVDWDTCY